MISSSLDMYTWVELFDESQVLDEPCLIAKGFASLRGPSFAHLLEAGAFQATGG